VAGVVGFVKSSVAGIVGFVKSSVAGVVGETHRLSRKKKKSQTWDICRTGRKSADPPPLNLGRLI
jgi:hypothetical protein